MEIQYRCPGCGAVIEAEGWDTAAELACARCGERIRIPGDPSAGEGPPEAALMNGRLARCPVCGGREFYAQRDFNRRLGLGLVVVGAILAWPTRGVSLLLVVLLDLALYFLLPRIVICYRCEAVFRGLPRDAAHPAFDLATEEKYRRIRAERTGRGQAGG
jgi:DNA-directed RNA polymerase subunit RPC12/RpoP